MNAQINIGKIVATFGTQGEVLLVHALGKKTNLNLIGALFIEITKGNKIPYFITNSKAKNKEEMYVCLEGVNSKEAARILIGKQIWVSEEDFRKLAGKQSAIALLGYSIVENGVVIGVVQEVIEQPHQILLSIQYKGNEAYIPLHEATLHNINHNKKEVHVVLPDGLLAIYES